MAPLAAPSVHTNTRYIRYFLGSPDKKEVRKQERWNKKFEKVLQLMKSLQMELQCDSRLGAKIRELDGLWYHIQHGFFPCKNPKCSAVTQCQNSFCSRKCSGVFRAQAFRDRHKVAL
jgi:hypothetical protein